jgi:hypothetical protein
VNGDEGFGMLPDRFFAALKWGDVTYEMFVVGSFLSRNADHRTKTYIGTLDEIATGVKWRKSPDTLGRVLDALKTGEWVEFERRQGQRRPYEIRLAGLLRQARLPHDFRKTEGNSAEVTSAKPTETTSANPLAESDGEPFSTSAENSDSPSTSKALRREGKVVGGGDREEGPVSLSLDGLDPDVRERVGKARAARAKGAGVDFDYVGTARPVCGVCGADEFFAHNGRCKACGTERSA